MATKTDVEVPSDHMFAVSAALLHVCKILAMTFHLSVRTSFPCSVSNFRNNACVEASTSSTYLIAPSHKPRTTAVPL